MPTKRSCLKLITSGFSTRKVQRMTSITSSEDEFLLFVYYTSAGLHRIWSSNFKSACELGKQYRPFLRGAQRLNNGYYILTFKNMQRWFELSSKIFMVGLIVLTGASRLSNRQIRCILYLFEQQLDQHSWCGWMWQQAASIAYGL